MGESPTTALADVKMLRMGRPERFAVLQQHELRDAGALGSVRRPIDGELGPPGKAVVRCERWVQVDDIRELARCRGSRETAEQHDQDTCHTLSPARVDDSALVPIGHAVHNVDSSVRDCGGDQMKWMFFEERTATVPPISVVVDRLAGR
jgi:hypothetical protein